MFVLFKRVFHISLISPSKGKLQIWREYGGSVTNEVDMHEAERHWEKYGLLYVKT